MTIEEAQKSADHRIRTKGVRIGADLTAAFQRNIRKKEERDHSRPLGLADSPDLKEHSTT